MRKYGYITGAFDVDTEKDIVWEFERHNEQGEIENFVGVETTRDLKNLNIISDKADDFRDWLNEFRPEETDEI